MTDYCPGAVQSPQPGGGGLNGSLPPRATWHITWDALRPDGSQPAFSAVANYLQSKEYCPHIMWNPFSGYMEQYYPAGKSARALAAWNEDGAVNVQVEVFFTPGCVVDGKKYNTVSETPLVGFDTLLTWMDSLGIPRVWPLGSPQWQGNSRDVGIWNTQGGHYGHCNVPDNTHTDPGPMPSLTGAGTISLASTSTTPTSTTPAPAVTESEEDFMGGTIDAQQAEDIVQATVERVLAGILPLLDNKVRINAVQAESIVQATTARTTDAVDARANGKTIDRGQADDIARAAAAYSKES
jgi:hypothetical protein